MNNYGIDYEEIKLKSGLKTILLRTPGYKSNTACIVAPIGGRICPLTIDGVEIPTGIAHFLEHRLFDTIKGDAFQLLSEIGCDSNAYTTFDYFQDLDMLLPYLNHIQQLQMHNEFL